MVYYVFIIFFLNLFSSCSADLFWRSPKINLQNRYSPRVFWFQFVNKHLQYAVNVNEQCLAFEVWDRCICGLFKNTSQVCLHFLYMQTRFESNFCTCFFFPLVRDSHIFYVDRNIELLIKDYQPMLHTKCVSPG